MSDYTQNYFHGDKQIAWDSLKSAYTRRITGYEMGESGGQFDYIAAAAPLPGPPEDSPRTHRNPNPHYKAHAEAFRTLRKLFDDEWK